MSATALQRPRRWRTDQVVLVLVGKSRAFFGAKRRRRLPKSPLESIAWTAGSTTLLVHGTWML